MSGHFRSDVEVRAASASAGFAQGLDDRVRRDAAANGESAGVLNGAETHAARWLREVRPLAVMRAFRRLEVINDTRGQESMNSHLQSVAGERAVRGVVVELSMVFRVVRDVAAELVVDHLILEQRDVLDADESRERLLRALVEVRGDVGREFWWCCFAVVEKFWFAAQMQESVLDLRVNVDSIDHFEEDVNSLFDCFIVVLVVVGDVDS